jgi:phage shock protein PspC (stress-responsive transcriptional regulator)
MAVKAPQRLTQTEGGMELLRSRLRRPRFTLAEITGVVAMLAVAFRWPIFILPTFVVVLTFLCDRSGLSLVALLIVASAVGVVLGIVGGVATSH